MTAKPTGKIQAMRFSADFVKGALHWVGMDIDVKEHGDTGFTFHKHSGDDISQQDLCELCCWDVVYDGNE